MGLDFSGSEASWSYTGFNEFRFRCRGRLAKEIGIDLNAMHGFGGPTPWEALPPPPQMAGDPIIPFLNHSDCEGELTPEEMRGIAPRMLEILNSPSWKSEGENDGDWEDEDKIVGTQLAEDMLCLVEEGENLVFC